MLFPEYGNFNKKIPIELMHPLSVDIIKHVLESTHTPCGHF